MKPIHIKSLFALIASIFLFTLMPGEAQAASCGGLNQKSCWSVNPKKWCNPGLKYVGNRKPGGGRCVKPTSAPKPKPKPKPSCGGLNQKSCWNVNPKKWCNPGLEYSGTGKPGEGRCIKPRPKPAPTCGGLNQKSCWNVNPKKWCNPGLEYSGTGKPGEGRCVWPKPKPKPQPTCGGLNQKSCWNVNPKKWCQPGLEYAGTGKPGDGRCIKPGSDYNKTCGGLNQSSCWNANPKKWCDPGLKYVGTGKPGEGRCVPEDTDLTPNCGGIGQKSCWNANPAKWCDEGLKYAGNGTPGGGRCLAPGEDRDEDCGGLDQKSCWSPNPANWCDGDLKYKPGIMPGAGRCVQRITKEEIFASAKEGYNRVTAIGELNPVTRLTRCLGDRDKLDALKDAMNDKSENAINTVLRECGLSYQMFRDYGYAALGTEAETLHIRLGGSAVLGIGAESAVGYALPLVPRPDGRFYITGGLGGGAGVAASGDVVVAVSTQVMPTNHWATDGGKSVNYSGKLLGGGGISIEFPSDSLEPTGIALSGSVGIGGEAGVLLYTADQYLYNH